MPQIPILLYYHNDLMHMAARVPTWTVTARMLRELAAMDNAVGVLGVAPKAKIACAKVLNDQGSGSDSSIISGLQWVLQNHAALGIAW